MRFFTFMLLMMVLLTGYSASAQNTIGSKRIYRVIAYRNGDSTITSQSNYLDLFPKMSVYIPNAFTPNGDGMNDMFGVRGEAIGQFQLVVYDRWGEEIFSTSNPDIQWDGKYQGHDAQVGAYAYKFIALGISKGQTEKSGTVTLVR